MPTLTFPPPFTETIAFSVVLLSGNSHKWNFLSIFWKKELYDAMIVIGTDLAEKYFAARSGHKGIRAARAQYDAWLAIAAAANWKLPAEVKAAHPKASILKSGRVVFNIKGNDYRLVAQLQYQAGVLMIRFFGSHEEYDTIDAEIV